MRAPTAIFYFNVTTSADALPIPSLHPPPTPNQGFFERKEMSKAQQDKLRKELLGFGGSPDTAMGANYYLYIIVIISALAVAAKLSGAF